MNTRERFEEYLAAIHRLRTAPAAPVPLSLLKKHFNFSLVSIHEMVQKLVKREWVIYHPYRGVTLTESGEGVARALLRRHRLWERFLTDVLRVPWDEAHDVAGNLEHAAPESVTERLANLLGDPDFCPHGEPIPPVEWAGDDQPLTQLPEGVTGHVTRITPESAQLLRDVQGWGLMPGSAVTFLECNEGTVKVRVHSEQLQIPTESANAIWVEV